MCSALRCAALLYSRSVIRFINMSHMDVWKLILSYVSRRWLRRCARARACGSDENWRLTMIRCLQSNKTRPPTAKNQDAQPE